jgi:D-glycero-beta-D-manno-heptose-7-phosphate kinase
VERVTPGRLDELLAAAAKLRVLIVGDVMLDRYVVGDVDRVSPEAPVPVVNVRQESLAAGGAGNVAANVAAVGARCDVVGCVGSDAAGTALLRELERLGVGTTGVVTHPGRPTTEKTRIFARHQQVVRFDTEVDEPIDDPIAAEIALLVSAGVAAADVLVIEDYDKGVLTPVVIEAALSAARSAGRPTVVDPKRLRFFSYPGVTVLKPNEKEIGEALGSRPREDDPQWMEETRIRLGCENLLLTLGERGMALQTDDGESVRIPTAARGVYDVSGAGDTVTAWIAAVLGAGGTATEAAVVANRAAAIEVGKSGVATVTPTELKEHMRAGAITNS